MNKIIISKTQKEALMKMKIGNWYAAYSLGVSIATLFALENKKLLIKAPCELGNGFFPQLQKFRLRMYKDKSRPVSPFFLK